MVLEWCGGVERRAVRASRPAGANESNRIIEEGDQGGQVHVPQRYQDYLLGVSGHYRHLLKLREIYIYR